ncbi:MAG: hypothetical protein HPY69_05895 [Armatimonadetes bacterium]|nr:hypothetical protein [Armatimonadota bacterium]
MRTRDILLGVVLASATLAPAAAQITIPGPTVTMALSEAGVWQSLRGADGHELCAAPAHLPLATVVDPQGTTQPVATASYSDGHLRLTFQGTDAVLTYAVEPDEYWTVLRLESVEGTRPQRLTLCQVPVNVTAHIGPRLNIAWDDKVAVCLLAATRQADCGARREGEVAVLRAGLQDAPGPKLEGGAVALIVAPREAIEERLREASHAFGLLTNEDASGTPVKRTDLPRGSYWFLGCGEAEVDTLIEYCRRAGFRQIMLSSGAWCTKVGHYELNTAAFPEGEKSLKRFVDKLHAAGILVGMHCFASKVSKTDAYVTPVPDRRFWVDKRTTLAEAIDATQTEIRAGDLSQWPGSPLCSQKTWEGGVDKHREVIVDDEIIQYEAIGPEGRWDTFLGCRRGAWGTQPAAHAAGAEGRHYGVDGCINGYIVDQETTLLDETTDRLAQVFNDCGFDMVYFDGGEDVDKTRFNYYVSRFQETAMRKFRKRPIIHMGTIMTHLTWHSFARSSTVDTYLNTLYGAIQSGAPVEKWPTVRDHIDVSVRYMLSVREDLMPGELGWFGIWPKGPNTDGLQLDEVEYLMGKSLGYDVPVSLQTSFEQMERHPLTPEILRMVRAYEELRMARKVAPGTRQQLQALGKDFVLLRHTGQPEFVPVEPLAVAGGSREVRALFGRYGGSGLATVWPVVRECELALPVDAPRVRALDFDGREVALRAKGEATIVPLTHRRLTLLFDGVTATQVREALERAEVRLPPAVRLVIPAANGRLVGEMALGSQVGVSEPEAFGDVVVCTSKPGYAAPQEWYAEYEVRVPRAGQYNLWARVRYPSGADDSFGVLLPGERLTLSGTQVLGNCGMNGRQWHWTGRGGGSTSAPPGEVVTLKLAAGVTKLRVYAREGPGTAAMNPRLDVLYLTSDLFETPTDQAVSALLRAEGK